MLIIEQALNGLQYGVTLFLLAAGLTLIFGIMNFINLAHGTLYMAGAFFAAATALATGSYLLAFAAGAAGAALLGLALERGLLRYFYNRDHLDQVLCTIGLIMIMNEGARVIWGPVALPANIPPSLSGTVELLPGLIYPVYRLTVILVGLIVAFGLYLLVNKTRLGMLVRAGASDREMVGALGADINKLYSLVFALGAGLAGLAGLMAGPILAVQVGMGDSVLVLTLVVIVIGGIGSVRGAFLAALLVGFVDTIGRVTMPASIADMSIYILMAAVLFWRPSGLFAPAR